MESKKIKRQYGLWTSPIQPVSLARGNTLAGLAVDQSGAAAWLELRSDRGVLVVQPAGGEAARDLNDEFSVRAKVGYGGGDFTADRGFIYFADAQSGRLYRQPIESGILPSLAAKRWRSGPPITAKSSRASLRGIADASRSAMVPLF